MVLAPIPVEAYREEPDPVQAMKKVAMPFPRRRARLALPEYHVRTEFRVPLAFAFRWCTDYTPDDAKLEKENYVRKIISRKSGRVVYEDLEEAPGGWSWSRTSVRLSPPDRWHMESVGSHRYVVADYRLTRRGPDRTQFDLWWRRAPTLLKARRLSKPSRERETFRAWRLFARAMERDHRADGISS